MIKDLAEAIKAALPRNTPFFVGNEHLDERRGSPRIVMAHVGEAITAGESWRDADSGVPLTSVYTRVVTVEHHLWGRDSAETESMLHEYLLLLHGIGGMQIQPGQAKWASYQDPSFLKLGDCCVLRSTVNIPVLKPERFGVLEEIAQDCCPEEGS